MSRALRGGLLALSLVGACSHNENKATDKVAAVAAPEPTPPTAATPPAAAETPAPSARPVAALRGLVLPPSEVGGFRTNVAGCASAPAAADQPPTRDLPPAEKVEAAGVATGLVVTHDVPHACCLAAKTSVRVEGNHVTIVDALVGDACRCRCGSTVRTAVGLGPGTYAVEVKSSEAGTTRTAWTGSVTVK